MNTMTPQPFPNIALTACATAYKTAPQSGTAPAARLAPMIRVLHPVRAALLMCFVLLLGLAAGVGDALAGERRVAFVVGNSAYTSVPTLPNPRHDAEAVAEALRKSGFEVITAFDLQQASFDSEFHRFIRSLANADVSLFYYSGHGIQVGGDNRIIPVDARLKSAQDLEVETISLRTIIAYMQQNSKSQVIYLDSCRNNPFPSTKFLVGPDKEVALTAQGLAPEEAAVGSLIAFSTQPGNVAVDGTGTVSPFTDSVVRQSFVLGVDVQTALMKVTQEVWQATQHKQRPWWSSTLTEPVYLTRPTIIISPDDTAVADASSQTPSVIVSADDQGASTAADANATPSANATEQIAGLLKTALAEPRRVPIGVGAVAMLSDLPILRANGAARIEVMKTPGNGVLYLDGKILAEGSSLDQAALAKVSFEPSLNAGGQSDSFGLKVVQQDQPAAEVTGSVAPYVEACDAEAGEPLDLQGVAPGKLPNEIDAAKALAACEDAAARYPGVARYQYELGRARLAGGDLKGASDAFNAAAAAGHLRAFYQLGHMAQRGQGRPQDLAEANRLYKIAADKGDPFAMLSYGRNLVRGRGVTADVEAGVKLLNRAAELGHTYAMNELGGMYYYGGVVAENPARGVRFFEASLSRNDIYAMNNMGLAYLEGRGVGQDPATALALFRKASDGGHPGAPTNIGRMYLKGIGVKKDIGEAIRWYDIAAGRGDTWGAANLAYIYTKGPKSFRDADKAVWYSALAKAVDVYGENPDAGAELAGLPAKAKARAIKRLVDELGASAVETATDLDQTLVILSRKLWQKNNPRFDLF